MMFRILFLLVLLCQTLVLPAFAEGFSYGQFAALIVVNLALGAVVALFVGVLISVVWHKFRKPEKVVVRSQREDKFHA